MVGRLRALCGLLLLLAAGCTDTAAEAPVAPAPASTDPVKEFVADDLLSADTLLLFTASLPAGAPAGNASIAVALEADLAGADVCSFTFMVAPTPRGTVEALLAGASVDWGDPAWGWGFGLGGDVPLQVAGERPVDLVQVSLGGGPSATIPLEPSEVILVGAAVHGEPAGTLRLRSEEGLAFEQVATLPFSCGAGFGGLPGATYVGAASVGGQVGFEGALGSHFIVGTGPGRATLVSDGTYTAGAESADLDQGLHVASDAATATLEVESWGDDSPPWLFVGMSLPPRLAESLSEKLGD